MALFGRERLPHRSTLNRFLAALDQAPVEALRTLFLEDLLARPLLLELIYEPPQVSVEPMDRTLSDPTSHSTSTTACIL